MSDDNEQPLGEHPELDLSYVHRDGRHVPVTLHGPTPGQAAEWHQHAAELGEARWGDMIDTPVANVPAWPTGEDILRAETTARHAIAEQAEAAEDRYDGPRLGEVVGALIALAVLMAVLVYLAAITVGAA